eukprot:scaffold2136_cov242-Pinguiococcus_pyrenoidosus.AAC.25
MRIMFWNDRGRVNAAQNRCVGSPPARQSAFRGRHRLVARQHSTAPIFFNLPSALVTSTIETSFFSTVLGPATSRLIQPARSEPTFVLRSMRMRLMKMFLIARDFARLPGRDRWRSVRVDAARTFRSSRLHVPLGVVDRLASEEANVHAGGVGLLQPSLDHCQVLHQFGALGHELSAAAAGQAALAPAFGEPSDPAIPRARKVVLRGRRVLRHRLHSLAKQSRGAREPGGEAARIQRLRTSPPSSEFRGAFAPPRAPSAELRLRRPPDRRHAKRSLRPSARFLSAVAGARSAPRGAPGRCRTKPANAGLEGSAPPLSPPAGGRRERAHEGPGVASARRELGGARGGLGSCRARQFKPGESFTRAAASDLAFAATLFFFFVRAPRRNEAGNGGPKVVKGTVRCRVYQCAVVWNSSFTPPAMPLLPDLAADVDGIRTDTACYRMPETLTQACYGDRKARKFGATLADL